MSRLPHAFLALPALLLGLNTAALAQVTDSTPAPNAVDVASLDSIVPALYASISGPVGQPRQWNRFLSLNYPSARLMPTRCKTATSCAPRILSPLQYRQAADSFLVTEGFSEREIGRRVERYGAIAQVFSAYASFRRGETAPFARGINSIQLFWDGSRWWVMSIFWDSERPDNPLPAEFVGSSTSH